MYLREVGCDPGEWIDLSEDRASLCKGGNEPPGSLKRLVKQLVLRKSDLLKQKLQRDDRLHGNTSVYAPSLFDSLL